MAKKNKEFEKNRQELLRMAREMGEQRKSDSVQKGEVVNNRNLNDDNSDKKYAWEYEILEYRRRRRIERYLVFGATCGVISLVMTFYFNWQYILSLFG